MDEQTQIKVITLEVAVHEREVMEVMENFKLLTPEDLGFTPLSVNVRPITETEYGKLYSEKATV